MSTFRNLTGQKFSRLTVLERNYDKEETVKNKAPYYDCRCECGKVVVVRATNLVSENTKSCGCLNRERTSMALKKRNYKHGFAIRGDVKKEYRIWLMMKNRCNNPNYELYDHYGGRGITYDPRWEDFNEFFKDMGPCPEDKNSLGRIDNNGPYYDYNCRWEDSYEQAKNKSTTIFVYYKGERMCLKEACRLVGINYHTCYNRIKNGWTPEEALTTPPGHKRGCNVIQK